MQANKAWAFWFIGLSSLAACVLPPPQSISGTVSGASSPVTLVNHADSGVYTTTSTNSGTFSFPIAVSQYDITANSPVQTCNVKNGSGQVSGAAITDVAVTCRGAYQVSVNVSGYAGGGNLLLTNGQDSLTVTQNGPATFAGTLNNGAPYNVSVTGNPNGQQCTVANGSGSMDGNVTVPVTCTAVAGYFLSGYVSGVLTSVTLQNSNNKETVTVINPNTHFMFPTPLEPNENYALTILTQPIDQVCGFIGTSGSGIAGVGNTNNIGVSCAAALRTVSVQVAGLTGALQVLNNGGDTLTATQNGAYTFATALHDNSVFNVTVGSQPKNQACVIPNPYGQVNGADIYNIEVNCESPSNLFAIGGIATGLQGSVTLSNVGIDTVTVPQDGAFSFPIHMTNNAFYDVYITQQPNSQSCSISQVSGNVVTFSGAGTVGGANVNLLRLNCGTGYRVSGAVTNLTSNTLRLLNTVNGTPLEIISVPSGASSFQFPTALPTNATYSVQVLSQPSGEVCTVSNAGGTVTNANITGVSVSCASGASHNYTVGGTVSGLSGTVVLSNNGFENVTVTTNSFTFPTALANTAPYDVTIVSQPASQICVVQNGYNTIAGANVSSVEVICQLAYAVTVPVTGLSGGNVVLQAYPWEPTVVVSSNGSYTFPNALLGNTLIDISVASSPNHQQCVVVAPEGFFANNFGAQVVCGPFYDFIRGQSAVSVVGQSGFYTSSCNGISQGSTSVDSICYPYGDAFVSSTSQVYLPDFGNNRALVYNTVPIASASNANYVLGQTNFTANASGTTATTLSSPMGVSGSANKLVVTDTANSRVLIYNTPVTSGASAAVVVGQSSMTTNAASCSAAGLNAPQSALIVGNSLYVADTGNNRALIYTPVPTSNGASASVVVGQASMTACSAPSLLALNGAVLNQPQDIWSDGAHLLIADTGDNRVLGYSSMPASGAGADVVLGQEDFVSYETGNAANQMAYPTSLAANGEQLFVVDSLNNRVLIFNSLPLYWAAAFQSPAHGPNADAELGQVDFGVSDINSLSGLTGPETLHKPSGIALNGNVLIVTDTGNNRFTIYNGF